MSARASARQPRRFPGDDGRTGTRAGDRGVEHLDRAWSEWRWPIVIAWVGGLGAYVAARALDVPVSIPELGIGGGTLTVGTALVLAFRVVRLVKGWSGVERQVGAVAVGQEALSTALDDRLRAVDERMDATGKAVIGVAGRVDTRTDALERRVDLLIAHVLGAEAVTELQAADRAAKGKGRRREDTAQADTVEGPG